VRFFESKSSMLNGPDCSFPLYRKYFFIRRKVLVCQFIKRKLILLIACSVISENLLHRAKPLNPPLTGGNT
jgi:hypothetical protein